MSRVDNSGAVLQSRTEAGLLDSRWLEAHDTSPLTNARLPHKGLVRNHALRSAIMEAQRRGG